MSDYEVIRRTIEDALQSVQPPKGLTELRAEYWKAGARKVIALVNVALIEAQQETAK